MCYLQARLSADFRAALSQLQRCPPKMGSFWVRFIGHVLNIKNKMASFLHFSLNVTG